MDNLEIKIANNDIYILKSVLKNVNFSYGIKKLNENYCSFIINKKYINDIMDLLSIELMNNGIDSKTQEINEYGKRIDNITGIFNKVLYG